jgi:hypothetical protein
MAGKQYNNAMTEQPIPMKTCRYCGKQTSVAANFCWYCARELEARPEHPMDEPHRAPAARIWAIVIGLVAVVVVVLLVMGR